MDLKFLYTSKKGLIEILRDKRQFMLILVFPVLFILIFSFAFGSGSFLSGGSIPHEVVVINNDVGVITTANNTTKYVNYGSNFTNVLEKATPENSTKNVFHLNDVNADKAHDMLKSRSIDALIVIPKNFSSAFVTMANNSSRSAITSSIGQQTISNSGSLSSGSSAGLGQASLAGANVNLPKAGNVSSFLTVEGDSGYINFVTTQMVVSMLFDQYKDHVKTAAAAPSAQTQALLNDSVPLEVQSIPGTQSFTLFDYMVPGLIVFALMLQVSVVAGTLVRDVEKGTLDRLKLSKVRSFDLLSGTFTVWSIITIMQIFVLIGLASALGYNHQGGFSSLGLATVIGLFGGMATISLALIIASFAKTERQATSLGAMLATPLGFLAGAFLPLPRQEIGQYAGQTYQVYDLLPWTHAINAVRSVLTYGSGLSPDVVFQMTWLIFLTAILFVVGVVTYSRARLRPER
ncbi:MAG: ABC transporter permease [Halobacteriota archaeon]